MGIRLGLCQTRVTRDKGENLRLAEAALRQAADQGANLALLPEMFNCPYENPCFPLYGEPAGGETWQFLAAMARELGLYLAGGSVPELEGDKVYNTCYLFCPPKGRSWPATGRSTSSTSTCRGASGSRSQTPWPPATRSRWWTPLWARWALPSALTFASPNSSGSWGTGGPSSSWCPPPST